MHILFTSDYIDLANIGGSGRVIVELARRLVGSGHTVEVLAGGEGAGRSEVELSGARVGWNSFAYQTQGSRGLCSTSWITAPAG